MLYIYIISLDKNFGAWRLVKPCLFRCSAWLHPTNESTKTTWPGQPIFGWFLLGWLCLFPRYLWKIPYHLPFLTLSCCYGPAPQFFQSCFVVSLYRHAKKRSNRLCEVNHPNKTWCLVNPQRFFGETPVVLGCFRPSMCHQWYFSHFFQAVEPLHLCRRGSGDLRRFNRPAQNGWIQPWNKGFC